VVAGKISADRPMVAEFVLPACFCLGYPHTAIRNAESNYFMKIKLLVLVSITLVFALSARAQETAFSYQGHLTESGAPAAGSYDFRFRLAADALGNNYVGSPVLTNEVPVSSGLFKVALDFGTGVFEGSSYWLQIEVRPAGVGNYTVLSPLQQFTSAPYAVHALSASRLDGMESTAFAVAGHDHDAAYVKKTGPDEMNANTGTHVLRVQQTGSGDGIVGATAATSAGRAGVEGISGSPSGVTVNTGSGVLGDSQTARGVIGVSASSDGVLGFSSEGAGINGQSTGGTGVRAFSQTGTALQVLGNGAVSGHLTVEGRINHPMVPIAIGYVSADGTLGASSGNVTSTWVAASNRYEISIAGHSYLFSSYVTSVTSICANYTSRTSSGSGRLTVQHYNAAGTLSQCGFHFVVYRP
jgi:hypothetical protein